MVKHIGADGCDADQVGCWVLTLDAGSTMTVDFDGSTGQVLQKTSEVGRRRRRERVTFRWMCIRVRILPLARWWRRGWGLAYGVQSAVWQ